MTLGHPTYQSAVHELMAHGYRPDRESGLETWRNGEDEILVGRLDGTDRIELVKLQFCKRAPDVTDDPIYQFNERQDERMRKEFG